MADETVAIVTDAPAATATEPTVTPPADATGSNSGAQRAPGDRTFTQADLDRIVTERLERASDKAKKDAAKAAADAETKVLAEQGKYKEIADKLQAELASAQQAAKASEMRLWQRDVAAKTGLPLPLAERLRGETADEMEADAKTILAALPKPAAPNINAGSGAGDAPGPGQLSEAQINEQAVRMGVNPKLLKQQYGM